MTGTSSGDVTVWRIESSVRKQQLRFDRGITSLRFSESGKRLVVATSGGEVTVWDVGNWDSVAKYQHGSSVTAVALSPDGRQVLVGDKQGRAVLWALESNDPRHSFGMGGPINTVDYGPSGDRVAVGTGAGTVAIRRVPPARRGLNLVKHLVQKQKRDGTGRDGTGPSFERLFHRVFGAPTLESVRYRSSRGDYVMNVTATHRWAGDVSIPVRIPAQSTADTGRPDGFRNRLSDGSPTLVFERARSRLTWSTGYVTVGSDTYLLKPIDNNRTPTDTNSLFRLSRTGGQ